jgi:CRISPR-associated protein Cas1
VFSKVQLTSDVINTCLREKIPVFFVTGNGRYLGKLDSLEYRNVEVLYKQISCAMSEECSLKYAKIFIKSKIHNSKVMLQRRRKKSDRVVEIDDVLESLNYYLKQIEEVDNLDSLR